MDFVIEETVIEENPPELFEIFLTDDQGEECVTQEGIDWIWPEDDRTPLEISEAGKGWQMPPTCPEGLKFVSCEEQHGYETCLKSVFDRPPLAAVPIGSSLPLILIAVVSLALVKGKKT